MQAAVIKVRFKEGDSDVEVTQAFVVLRAAWMDEVPKNGNLERWKQTPKG